MGDYKESKRFLQKFERNTQRFTPDSLALAYKVYRKLGQRRTASNYGNMLVKMYPNSWEGKQYLLNELEFIEADELARKYRRTQRDKNNVLSPTGNKRVVKLSPKKVVNTPFTHSTKSTPSVIKTNVTAGSQVAAVVVGSKSLTSIPERDTAVTNLEETALTSKPTETVLPVISDKEPYQLSASNIAEPTSTQPVPAVRDVPLPEALPEPLPEKVEIETVAVQETSKSTENIDSQDVLHTVTPGENLYSISVEYNVKLKALRQWNNISEKNKIRIGDKLYVVDPQTVKNINE
jgi:type IV pilus assembly protein PilF